MILFFIQAERFLEKSMKLHDSTEAKQLMKIVKQGGTGNSNEGSSSSKGGSRAAPSSQ